MTEPMKGLAEWLRAQATEREKHEAHQIFPHGANILRHWAAEVEASRLPLAGAATSDEPKCPRCGLPQAECDFQKNFPDPEPFDGEAWEQAARYVAANPRPIEEIRRDITALRESLGASPAPSDAAVQQPVAWMVRIPEYRRNAQDDVVFYYRADSAMLLAHRDAGDEITPLYSLPAARAGRNALLEGAREATLDRLQLACHERGMAIQRQDTDRAGQWLTIIDDCRAALYTSPLPTAPAATWFDPTTGMSPHDRCRVALECLPDAPYRKQLSRLFDDLLPTAPAGAREALELARPYVEAAIRRMYDGTNGQGMRDEAKRRIDLIDAALAAAPLERIALSDEQIVALAGRFEVGERNSNHWGFAWHDFARAIEAEHGITLAQKGDVNG